ncbi:type 1 glutamine amidotransferase [Nocardioides sp. GY 10127]|uniref:type 1 glutamine amidotransferase n=1 Tax=Nocardioides sp. GY 10127 TaxID=2569762 RepID=UPI001457FD7B|nr:type 1 glutamine amidotransferase [Nocardioides sp. GY 10127]
MSRSVLVVEHEDGTGPEYLGEVLAGEGLLLDVRRPYLGDPLPDTLAGYDGLIVLGGTPGWGDDHVAPWLPAARVLLRRALDEELPLLGVCLGGQLLASVAGGQVARSEAGPEIGLHPLSWRPEAATDVLFSDLPPGAPAMQWHYDHITELPLGAVLLASTDRFPHQAYRLGERAWGMQFHMEVLTPAAKEWASSDRDALVGLGLDPDGLVEEVRDAEPQLRDVWGRVARRWAALV